tara:strand:- start:9611 stop:9787 length:177 start_codon:yes stop_codon:yes gene_type:complete
LKEKEEIAEEKQFKKSIHPDYPADFELLFGSISDESFTVPDRLPLEANTKRERHSVLL